MSKKIITADVAKEFIAKAKEKNYSIYAKDYGEATDEDLDALLELSDELSMENWMQANVTDYATVTALPNDFYLEAASHTVTSLKGVFAGCAALTTITQFDTRNVTDFTGMFDGCTSLPSVLEFFFQCDSITDLSHVAGMFAGSSIKTARLENLDWSLAAKLITSPSQLGSLDKVIINGYCVKVVTS